MEAKKLLSKCVKERNGQKYFLLGLDREDKKVWLAEPSWDCEWYWGGLYLNAFTGSGNPESARDILYHYHVDSSLIGANNGDKTEGEYCSNPYSSKLLKETTFTYEEGWKLGELFRSFYILKESAGYFHTGGAHISSADVADRTRLDLWEEFNQKLIPKITEAIVVMLTPKA